MNRPPDDPVDSSISPQRVKYQAFKAWATEPLSGPPALSVVIPTYNEEIRILPTIGAMATHISSLGIPWELIVADDGSTDATVELIDGLGFPNLCVLAALQNTGKGDAVRRGALAARGDRVLFADADQSTPVEELDRMLAAMDQGADVVVGSRAAEGAGAAHKSALRHVMSAGLRLALRVALPLPVTDSQCGFKLFTSDAAQTLFGRQLLDGFAFDMEILYLAKKSGLEIVEVPVSWIDAPGSTVDPARVALSFLQDMVRIRAHELRGDYGPLGSAPAAVPGRA